MPAKGGESIFLPLTKKKSIENKTRAQDEKGDTAAEKHECL